MATIPCAPVFSNRHAAAVAAGVLVFVCAMLPARAGSIACQTVNGVTHCLEGNGVIACTTVDGKSSCRVERFSRPVAKPEGGVSVLIENGRVVVVPTGRIRPDSD